MELTDDNRWTWQPFWDEHDKLVDKHNDLVKRWNVSTRGGPRDCYVRA